MGNAAVGFSTAGKLTKGRGFWDLGNLESFNWVGSKLSPPCFSRGWLAFVVAWNVQYLLVNIPDTPQPAWNQGEDNWRFFFRVRVEESVGKLWVGISFFLLNSWVYGHEWRIFFIEMGFCSFRVFFF